MHSFIISIFVLTFGIPLAILILLRTMGRATLQDVILLSSVIGPTVITYFIFILGYSGLLSRHTLLLISLAALLAPLLSKGVRSVIASALRIRLRVFYKNLKDFTRNLTTLEASMLSLTITLVIFTAPSALLLPPVLRDPYAVWLFYGKKIAETSTIPLFYGNDPGISWSGNYPPMISFMAAYYFILLNRVDPTFNHISWLFSVLLLLATYLLAKEMGLNRGSIIAAFMLTTSSLFTLSLVNYGYVTVVWAYYITVSVYYLVKLVVINNARLALLFGLGLGAAMLTTYTSFFLIVAIILTSTLIRFYYSYQRKGSQLSLKHILLGLSIGLLILTPWLIRNIILLGNPVYPWFHNVLGGRGLDPEVMSLIPRPRYNLKLLLIDNTFQGGDIGYPILVYGLTAIYYLLRNKNTIVTYVSTLALILFILLLSSMVIYCGFEHYLLVIAPLFSVLAGELVRNIFSSNDSSLKVLIVLTLIILSLPSYGYAMSLAKGVAPGETQALSIIQRYMKIHATSNSTVLTNEIQFYFIDQKIIHMYNVRDLFHYKTSADLVRILKRYHIDYVLINTSIDPEVFERVFNDLSILAEEGMLRKLVELHPYTLYKVENYEG
mgnify:CR=1 FL=1|jgi:hypothetical protein